MRDVATGQELRRLKVAHVATDYHSVVGALDVKLRTLSSYPDLDVSVYSSPAPSGSPLPAPGVEHHELPLSSTFHPLGDLRSLRRLVQSFRRDRPDVVHTHSVKAGAIGAVAARLAGVELVVHTYHGLPYYKGQGGLAYFVHRSIEIAATRFRDHLLSQNRADLRECAKLIGDWNRVSFEGNGVDADDVFARAIQGRPDAESDFAGSDPEAFRIVMLTRLDAVKRVHDFIQACAILDQRQLNFVAVVAGVGSRERALRAQIAAAGIADRVRLVGRRENSPALLAAGDAAVLTSEHEGTPRSLMEAMALRKPVVAVAADGTRELVHHERTGWLTPIGDPQTLADRLVELAEDAPLQRWFGAAGQARIEKHFDDRRVAAHLRELYYERLGRPLPAPPSVAEERSLTPRARRALQTLRASVACEPSSFASRKRAA